MLCDKCPKRDKCVEICPLLAKELPSMEQGSFAKFLAETHQSLKQVYEQMERTKILISNRDALKGRERQVFDAYYLDAKTSDEIAQNLGLSLSEVKAILKKAYHTIQNRIYENYQRKYHSERKKAAEELAQEVRDEFTGKKPKRKK